MAKCKLCKTDIPDGTEYCKDCMDKEKAKANESYLDSLLNSVKNTTPATESIYKKKSDSETDVTETISDTSSDNNNFQDDDMFQFNPADIEEFDQFDMEEDMKDDIYISDKDLFGEDLTDASKEDTLQQSSPSIPAQEEEIDVIPVEAPILEETNTINQEPVSSEPESSESIEADHNISTDNINSNEIEEDDDYGLDTDLNDLLNQLDSSDQTDTADEDMKQVDLQQKAEEDIIEDTGISAANPEEIPEITDEDQQIEEDDFLTLLNQISSDDPVSDDVKAISDLMKDGAASPAKQPVMPSDVGEVFSDALKAVSNLNDPNLDEDALLNQIPDKKSPKKEKVNKTKKAAKPNKEEAAEEKPKISLFKRLFGNVEDKKTHKKEEISLQGMEESVSLDDKKSKPKKGKKGKAPEEEQDTGRTGRGKAEETEEPDEGKGKKKKKKEKKNKAEAAIQVIDEIDEDVGRINRLGATIVFVFFGLMALLIYVGTNAITYTLNIEHATSYFNKQKYTQAYDQVYGMKIEDDDVEIYSKIMTIMFVNKQLNSYNNYCALKEYPEALDSLLKGLKRYDKYIELAKMFSIEDDMDYVRDQILAELKNKFKLSEKDAVAINNIENMKDYSLKVYDIALQNE